MKHKKKKCECKNRAERVGAQRVIAIFSKGNKDFCSKCRLPLQ